MADDKKIDDELNFDFGAKKKKKKVVKKEEEDQVDEAPSTSASAAPAANEAPQEADQVDDLLDKPLSEMKKKKKKKPIEDMPEDDLEAKPEEKAEEDLDGGFEDLKKKKKKTKNLQDFENELKNDEDFAPEESSSRAQEDQDHEIKFDSTPVVEDPWANSDRDYTYTEILDRAFRIIRQANPDMDGGKKRYTMIPPQVMREGTKKTLFTNVAEICKRMHRPPEHVNSFLFSELGTTGSVDGNNMLVIKGKFVSTQIENVLRSYILEYVTCKICKSPDTTLTKENRLTFMQCHSCGAKRSVASIKSGFSAQVDRRNKPQ